MPVNPRAKFDIVADDKTAKALRSAEQRMQRFGRSVKRTIAGLGLGLGVVQLVRMGKQAIDSADQMLKLTERIGGTTEALSELEFVAERSGIQFNTLTMGMQRMVRRIAEAAEGTGEAKDALKELELNAQALRELPLDQQLEQVADALAGVKNQSDRVRLAMKLLDSEGVVLLQMMTRGAAGIRELRAEGRALGKTLSQDQAEAARDAKDALTNLEAEWSSLTRNLTIDVAPTLTNIIDKLDDVRGAAGTGLRGLGEFLDRLLGEERGDRITAAFDSYKAALGELESLQASANTRADIAASLQDTIADKQKEVNRLYEHWRRLTQEAADAHRDSLGGRGGDDDTPFVPPPPMVDPAELEKFLRQFETAEQKVARLTAELVKFKGELSPAEFQRIRESIQNELIEGIEEIDLNKLRAAAMKPGDLEDALSDSAKAARDAFDDLGFTMSSHLEDAILRGEELRGVMQGLLQDIIQIGIRSAVTKPLGTVFAGFFSNLPGFQHGGSFRVGGSGGTDSQLVAFRASPDETVTVTRPGQGTVNEYITVNVDSRTDRQQVEQAVRVGVMQARQAAVGDVRRLTREGRLT